MKGTMRRLLMGTALTGLMAGAAAAAPKAALVLSTGPDHAAQAIAMSESLLGLGFDVIRLDTPSPATVEAALQDLAAHDGPAVVFAAGVPVDPKTLQARDDAPRFVFLDACDTDVTDAPQNTVLVTPDAACDGDVAMTVQDWVMVPGLGTDQWSGEGVTVTSTLSTPYVFRQPASDVTLSAADYALLDTLSPEARARMISLWRDAGIVVDVAMPDVTTIKPVRVARDTVQVIAPVRAGGGGVVITPVTPVVPTGGQVVTSAPPPTTSEPADASGPVPSILVGFVVDAATGAPQVPEAPVAGEGFSTDDIAAREALRSQDADVFAGLLDTGAFDPPAAEVARALQIELGRLNCYSAGIDGVWGAGSGRALTAFYDAAGTSGDITPTLAAFRAVVAADGVRCPDVVVAQPAAQPAPSQASAPAPARSAPAAAPAPAAPAPTPSSPRRSISQTGGSGIFR